MLLKVAHVMVCKMAMVDCWLAAQMVLCIRPTFLTGTTQIKMCDSMKTALLWHLRSTRQAVSSVQSDHRCSRLLQPIPNNTGPSTGGTIAGPERKGLTVSSDDYLFTISMLTSCSWPEETQQKSVQKCPNSSVQSP
jgi:hypothetical protein